MGIHTLPFPLLNLLVVFPRFYTEKKKKSFWKRAPLLSGIHRGGGKDQGEDGRQVKRKRERDDHGIYNAIQRE